MKLSARKICTDRFNQNASKLNWKEVCVDLRSPGWEKLYITWCHPWNNEKYHSTLLNFIYIILSIGVVVFERLFYSLSKLPYTKVKYCCLNRFSPTENHTVWYFLLRGLILLLLCVQCIMEYDEDPSPIQSMVQF